MNNKIIDNLVKKSQQFIKNTSHYGNHENYIACNVKLYDSKFYIDEDDILAICKELNLSKTKCKYANSYFNNKEIQNITNYYLEDQAHFLQEEFFNKCCISTTGHWNKQIENTIDGKEIGYPDIIKIKSVDKRVKKLEKWKKEDEKESNYIDILKHMGGLSGFFGRSCGWYAILKVDKLENLIDEIQNDKSCFEDKIYFYNQLKDLYNACEWAYKIISDMKDGLNLKEEIKYRMTEELENEGFIEDSSVVNYAIN